MDKVFVLVVNVTQDYQVVENSVDVYKDEEKAKNAFKSKVSEYKEDEKKRSSIVIDEDTDYDYESYEDGYASDTHTYIHLLTKDVIE